MPLLQDAHVPCLCSQRVIITVGCLASLLPLPLRLQVRAAQAMMALHRVWFDVLRTPSSILTTTTTTTIDNDSNNNNHDNNHDNNNNNNNNSNRIG